VDKHNTAYFIEVIPSVTVY